VDRVLQFPAAARSPRRGDAPDDATLLAALRAGDREARGLLVDRYGPFVRRVLFRVLGADDADRADLLQEIFLEAFAGVERLESAGALKAWLARVAVCAARDHLRRKRRRSWLTLWADPPERAAPVAGDDVREAARCVYAILAQLPIDERIPLALQVFEGLELEELASACDMSYSTVRRRLERARRRFMKLATGYEALAAWMEPADTTRRRP
jgi:RNA polymerase sigma-70 factor (ECF subfamily)